MPETLRDIATEMLELLRDIGEESIWERSGNIDRDLAKWDEEIAEYRRRIDSAT